MFSNQIKSKLTDSKKDEVPAEFEEMHPKINSFLLVIHLLLHDCISTHMSLNIYGSNRNDILSHYMFFKISQEKTKYVEERFFKFFSSPPPPSLNSKQAYTLAFRLIVLSLSVNQRRLPLSIRNKGSIS